MRLSALTPLLFAGAIAVAGVAAAVSPASAQPAHLSDSDYLTAAHCVGVAEGLGADNKSLDKWMDDESFNHPAYIVDQAKSDHDGANRTAQRASGDLKTKLEGQRDGYCKVYLN